MLSGAALDLLQEIGHVEVCNNFAGKAFGGGQLLQHGFVMHHVHQIGAVDVVVGELKKLFENLLSTYNCATHHRHSVALDQVEQIVLLVAIPGPHLAHSRHHVAARRTTAKGIINTGRKLSEMVHYR